MNGHNLWFGRCLLVGGSLFLAALIVEYAFVPKLLVRPITITAAEGEYILTDNIDLLYVPVPGRGDFNNAGHRGEDFSLEKHASLKRIIFFGDSVTDGAVDDVQFSGLLQDHYPTTEILNFAVQGYNLVQEFEYLKTKGINYKPDEVFFLLTYNDLELHSGEIDHFWTVKSRRESSTWYRNLYDSKEAASNWLLYFNSYRYLLGLLHANRDEQPHYKLDEEGAAKLIEEMIRYCKERDIGLNFVILRLWAHLKMLIY
jgi:hypothetical protein